MKAICFFLMIYNIVYLLLALTHMISKDQIVLYYYLSVITLLYFLISHLSFMKNRLIGTIIYDVFICLLFLFATLLWTMYSDNMAVTFQVILVMLPFLYIDTPRRSIPLILINMVIFMIFAILYKEGKTQFNDVFNTVIFGLLAIYSNFMITSKLIKEFAYEQMIEEEHKFDGLTQVYTKNLI